MPLPIVGHHDAAQIGMAFKANAEQIEDFALVKVGRGPDRSDGLDGGSASSSITRSRMCSLNAWERMMVAQLKARRSREPVYRGHILKKVVAGRLHGGRGGANLIRRNGQRQFVEVESCIDQARRGSRPAIALTAGCSGSPSSTAALSANAGFESLGPSQRSALSWLQFRMPLRTM